MKWVEPDLFSIVCLLEKSLDILVYAMNALNWIIPKWMLVKWYYVCGGLRWRLSIHHHIGVNTASVIVFQAVICALTYLLRIINSTLAAYRILLTLSHPHCCFRLYGTVNALNSAYNFFLHSTTGKIYNRDFGKK